MPTIKNQLIPPNTKLTPQSGIPCGIHLTDQKKLFAREMEVYAVHVFR
jgi:hypothetical protein